MSELKYLFGPAPSRRLGRSLGINIVPAKICSLDCLYCEAGRTKTTTMRRKAYYKAEDILKEFKENFDKFDDLCDVITVTGAGEPTLNSELDNIITGIKEITNKPCAILTNTTTIHINEVFMSLLKFDIVVPSLDAVIDNIFKAVNLPEKSVDTVNIIAGLEKFSKEYNGKLFIEILFCKNVNDSKEHIESLIKVLKNIKCSKVQIGTIHRPPAYNTACPVSDEFLLETAKLFLKHNISAEVTGGFKNIYKTSASLDLDDLIPALLKMRPCTLLDMSGVFGKSESEIKEHIDNLRKANKIKAEYYNSDKYYTTV